MNVYKNIYISVDDIYTNLRWVNEFDLCVANQFELVSLCYHT